MYKLLLLTTVMMLLVGCTTKDWYELGQDHARSECRKEAKTQAQYDNCEQLDDKNYKEYKREREQVINQP